MDVEGNSAFIYVEEDMLEEENYQTSLSTTGIELEEITHVDETTLPDARASNSGETSKAASISVNMDPASKRMVDNLVGSETTDDGEDAGFIDNPTNEASRGFGRSEHRPSPAQVGDETSYGLIGSSTVREHFGDFQNPISNSPRPILPSITNSPFALQPGEETPGSRPSTAKRKTPSHSQQNSQTRFPLQRQAMGLSVASSPSNLSSMPDPTAPNSYANGVYGDKPLLKNTFHSNQTYMRPGTFTTVGNQPLRAEEPNFLSLEVFEGSTWAGSDQSGRMAANALTPPNGQGAG